MLQQNITHNVEVCKEEVNDILQILEIIQGKLHTLEYHQRYKLLECIIFYCKKQGYKKESLTPLLNLCMDYDLDVNSILQLTENDVPANFKPSQLKEFLDNNEIIKLITAIKNRNIQSEFIENDDGFVYYVGNNGQPKKIGQTAKITHKIIDIETQKVYYLMENQIIPKDIKRIEEILDFFILDEKKYKQYLNEKFQNNINTKFLVKKTGWHNNIFLHPAIQTTDIHKNMIAEREAHIPKNIDKQHTYIKEILKEGKLLALCYCFSLSAVINKIINTSPTTLLITGTSGVGKTTASILACNLFYDTRKIMITLNATQNAMEIIAKQFSDLTVLLDEAALKTVDMEKAIFMINSQSGKARATKDLALNLNKLSSNIIFTSEMNEADEFTRTGSHRRMIHIYVSHYNDFTNSNMTDYLDCFGAGIDIIKFIQEYIKTIEFQNMLLKETKIAKTCKDLYNLALQLLVSCKILENFYNIDAQKTYKLICSTLLEIESSVYNKKDIVGKFTNDITQFIAINHDKFVTEKQIPKSIYGQIIDENEFYITLKAFQQFVTEHSYHKEILLKELEKNNILQTTSYGRRKTVRLCSVPTAVYHIILQDKTTDIISNP